MNLFSKAKFHLIEVCRISMWHFVLLAGSLKGQVVISEIMAHNGPEGFLTEEGAPYDWVELQNQGGEDVDLKGYFLTDVDYNLKKWTFKRSFVIPAGGHRVVFASNRVIENETEEHLNFRLSSTHGEYLALTDPDGVTVLSEFSPAFPPMFQYVAYGRIAGGDTLGILESATPNAANSGAAVLPLITSFVASGESIAGGEQVTLSWETANAQKVQFWGEGDEPVVVEASGSVTLRPDDDIEYKLTAMNQYVEVDSRALVTVGAAVAGFSAKPAVIASGGSSVLRWQLRGTDAVASLDGLSLARYDSPLLYTPSNEEVVPRDASWKVAPSFPGEGWQAVEFDDETWGDIEAPLDGEGYFFRTTFNLENPSELKGYTLRIPKGGEFGMWINGVKLVDAYAFDFPVSARYDYPVDAGDLRVGRNVLSFQNYAAPKPVEIELTAWRPQAIDTVIPVTLTSTNAVGASSRTVEITVLAADAEIPAPVPISFTEFFWGYFGTYPTEPYRFFEIHNHGNDPVDLTGYQLAGSEAFDFTLAVPPVLESGGYALVVAHHPSFMEIWPGDRPVLGTFENPQLEGTYDWGFDERILDPYGRTLERISSSELGVLGDLFVPPERVDINEPENDPENWVINYEGGGNIGAGGGTPGEGRLEFLDFSFTPETASPGETVTLSWEVSRDAELSITGIGEVSGPVGSVPYKVPLDASSIWLTLTAETSFHVFQKGVALTLPPRVTNLWSRTPSIKPGDPITLSWNSLYRFGAVSRRLDPEIGPIGNVRFVTFTPLVSGFQRGTHWRYFARDGGPGDDWKDPEFSTNTWGEWSGVMGYGNAKVTKELVPSEWITAYFRREFYVGEVNEVDRLFLDLLVDDGAEVYLNGLEVLRENLPEGVIDGDTPALGESADDGLIYRTFEIAPSSLVEGKNVIAVGVHNLAADDEDLVFDMGLRAQRPVPESGRKTYTLSSTNEAGTDEVRFTVLFEEPVLFADWALENDLSGDPESTDSDGDGLSDLLEYALGENPREFSGDPIKMNRNSAGELVMSHSLDLRTEPLRVLIEASYDLALWAPISATGSNYVFESAIAPDGSSVAEVIYRSYGPAEEGHRYYRLKVRRLE